MPQIFGSWMELTWKMIADSALMLIFGFMLAGLIRALLTQKTMRSVFGKSRIAQIFKASIIGIPLPLCSCSVLPVAAQLRRSGLSREGTVSFLISTPETGADSIALSVRLLGPIFAMVRPVAALIVAIVSGLLSRIIFRKDATLLTMTLNTSLGEFKGSWISRLRQGQEYIMKKMFPELAYYLFWGYLTAGLAAALIPGDLLKTGLASWLQYLTVIAVGLPVYVCATSSTPLAAVLLSLGIMPGAVLAFLLVGPATNITALMVQKQILGLKPTIVMTISIITAAILCGIMLDYSFGESISTTFSSTMEGEHHESTAWYDLAAAIILSSLMAYHTGMHYVRKFKKHTDTE
jgi:uncharacterized membrane protein YraQ (UPF0718 family)